MAINCAKLERWLDLGIIAANDNYRSDAARLVVALGLRVADWQDEALFEFECSDLADPDFARRFADAVARGHDRP